MRRLVFPFTAVLLVLSSFTLTARTPARPLSGAQAPAPGSLTPGIADTRMMSLSTTALASDDRSPGYVSTYYPGAILPGAAQAVTVGLGQEVQGITIPLVPSRTATLAGVVFDPQGRPAAGAHLGLMERVGGTGTGGRSLGGSGVDGTFSASGVVPGEYTLHARDGATGVTPVIVTGADLGGLVVTLVQPATLRGRITAGEGSPPAGLQTSDVRVTVREVPRVLGVGTVGAAFIDRDWTFAITNITGTGRLHVQTPAGWALRALEQLDHEIDKLHQEALVAA